LGRLLFMLIEIKILRRQISSNNTTTIKGEQGYKYRVTSLFEYPDRHGKKCTTSWKLLTDMRLDRSLRNLIQLKMSLLTAGRLG